MKLLHILAVAGSIRVVAAASCSGNTAADRTVWCDYDISTDYYTEVPDTGVTREYYLEVTDVTIAPDGYSRPAQAINGTIPGPTIIADWGDTVVVHLTNSLTTSTNGTSFHFHGIRQNYTNPMDGVVSITQCALAPNESMTYTWRATQYGSSWYHSHFALQAWEGVFGGILINGPASSNYDEDKGVLFLNDWSHQTVDELWTTAESSGPPTLDNALINGTNVYGSDDSDSQTGYRFNMSFTEGTSYRLRLVNAAIDTMFKFSIDDHTMTVIASDFVPIEPFETTVLSIGIAQRYDVIITANQSSVAENFWMRAIPQSACSDNDNTNNIKGIVYYGDSPSTPNTTGYSYTDSCDDVSLSKLVPIVEKDVSATVTYDETEDVTVGFNSDNLFRWYLNGSSLQTEWGNATLYQIADNITTFKTAQNLIELTEANEWVYLLIETTLGVTHPIHLHGHDFYILSQGSGTYNSSDLNTLTNPPRRDTAMLPASGHLLLAWKSDNPGIWLMHCHIGWHQSEGLALQWLEQYSTLETQLDYESLNEVCEAWNSYATSDDVEEDDSGI